MRIAIAGENALLIHFGTRIDPDTATLVQQSTRTLQAALGDCLLDLVPSYASLLVLYDPARTTAHQLRRRIRQLLGQAESDPHALAPPATIELPVYYSLESGPDLERIASHNGLGIEDVIRLHSSGDYRVYALGFAPGFAYLGEVDRRIAMARHATP
ncbi:MAG: allophanate hydrolase, partial [Gammaproteobacteria bacterium BRH_c0]